MIRRSNETLFSSADCCAVNGERKGGLPLRLRRRAAWSLIFLGAALCCGSHTTAQDTAPLAGQKKPAGADRGVLLNVVAEKDLQIAPPAGAIYNFGTADRFLHPTLTHTFTLRNDGKIPVVIDHIQSSCGCTSGLLIANGKEAVGFTLQPGKTVAIKTAVDVTKLAPGTIKKFLWVMMPGETVPSFAIRLDVKIEGVLAFDPPAVEFGRMQIGDKPTQMLSVTLDKRLLDAVGGVRLVSSNPDILLTPTSATDTPLPGGDGHSVLRTYKVTLSPQVSLGVLSGTLAFIPLKSTTGANKTNLQTAAETASIYLNSLSANVTGEIFGKVTARPGSVVFGPVTQGDSTIRRITLVGKTAASLQNLKVTSPSAWITAKVSVPERPKPAPNAPPQNLPPMMLLEVTLNSKAPAGALQTQLVLTTQDGERLVLPAFGYITPAVKQ